MAVLLVLGTIAAWLWPLGVGGRMPVGGDATRFSIGLMAEYDRALAEGRIPLWNARWGYGFPGLAESQMGVYYPPHVLMYGLLSTEAAYTASLALHTFWAAIGVLWAARRFGLSASAGVLAAVSWAGSGFFAIHLAHPWAITVGSWMPWAWGLAWGLATGESRFRRAFWLAIVLAIQVLPGHFQIAFITQVSAALLVLAGARGRAKAKILALAWLAGAGVLGMSLASSQLLPTYRLATLAESDRDFGYLSGFATPPMMLVSYVAPGLFHGSPLWRPIVWDPLHASPEEHLGYVGIVPLILALGAIGRRGRSDAATRALAVVAIVTLLLSFGPYMPGFRWLIHLPGFSFFRAPARWGVASQLALSMLGGVGFDLIRRGDWRAPSRSLLLGAVASGLLGMVAIGAVEAVAWSATSPPGSASGKALRAALASRPWPTAPDEPRRLREGIRGAPSDGLVVEGLLRRGEDPLTSRWERDRAAIYREELSPTWVVLGGVGLAVVVGRWRRRWLLPMLMLVTAADMIGMGHARRLVESSPIAPLTEQSTVLGALAALPDGSRVLAGLGNLPMVAGASALESYRTLDRPILGALTAMAAASRPGEPAVAARIVGARLLAWPGADRRVPNVRDEALTRWLYGEAGATMLGASGASYSLWEPTPTPVLAWFLPDRDGVVDRVLRPGDEPSWVLSATSGAQAVGWSSRVPEEVTISASVDSTGLLLLTMLDDPEWEATASREGGAPVVLPIARAFASEKGAGWMAVRLAEPGRWEVRLRYRGDLAATGRKISIGLLSLLLLGYGIGPPVVRWCRRRVADVGNEGGKR